MRSHCSESWRLQSGLSNFPPLLSSSSEPLEWKMATKFAFCSGSPQPPSVEQWWNYFFARRIFPFPRRLSMTLLPNSMIGGRQAEDLPINGWLPSVTVNPCKCLPNCSSKAAVHFFLLLCSQCQVRLPGFSTPLSIILCALSHWLNSYRMGAEWMALHGLVPANSMTC